MEKKKQFPVPTTKNIKSKRPATVAASSSSRDKASINSTKNKPVRSVLNNTIIDHDMSIMKKDVGSSAVNFAEECNTIKYEKFVQTLLKKCIMDEKFEREESELDLQMAQLADRFQKTMDQLDKTNRRMKSISFVVEQKRLLDLKNKDSQQFYDVTENSNIPETIENLNKTEQTYLDKLQTKNVDFGYDKDSGHKQLLDAVNDAIDGLEQIKKHSKLDAGKFKEYAEYEKNLDQIQKTKLEMNSSMKNFESKFPEFWEKFLMEASEKIDRVMDDPEDD